MSSPGPSLCFVENYDEDLYVSLEEEYKDIDEEAAGKMVRAKKELDDADAEDSIVVQPIKAQATGILCPKNCSKGHSGADKVHALALSLNLTPAC